MLATATSTPPEWVTWLVPAGLAFFGAVLGGWVNVHQHQRDREERAAERLWHARVDIYATTLRATTDTTAHLRPGATVTQEQLDVMVRDMQDCAPLLALLASREVKDALGSTWKLMDVDALLMVGSDGDKTRDALSEQLGRLRAALRNDLLAGTPSGRAEGKSRRPGRTALRRATGRH